MKTLALGWPGAVVACVAFVGMLLTMHSRLFLLFCLLLLSESSLGLWYRLGPGQQSKDSKD